MHFVQANWVDLVIIGFLLIYVFSRLNRGFIDSLFDLGGFLLSLFTALAFYDQGAKLVTTYMPHIPVGFSNAIGFFFIAVVVEIIFALIAFSFVKKIPNAIHNHTLNHMLGTIPSFFSGLILITFFLIAVIALPVRPNIKQDVLQSHIGNLLTHNTFGIETDVNQVFGGVVKEALKFITVKPESDESVSLNFKTDNFESDPQAEQQMLVLVNKERTSRGLSALSADEPMRAVARAHCEDMFIRGYFSHYSPDGPSPFDRIQNAGIEYMAAGENLAYAPAVDIAHEGLMNSPGHRANILSKDFGRVGIGVINAGVYGRMFCQEFRD